MLNTTLENGYVRLVPEIGYVLFNKETYEIYSEAVVLQKDKNGFIVAKNNF